MQTKTHFEDTDRNSYIPITSCHYRPWITNIPRGRYMRLKRNCTTTDEFEKQSDKITSMFKGKGYQEGFLEREKNRTRGKDLLLLDKKGISMVLDYNLQFSK